MNIDKKKNELMEGLLERASAIVNKSDPTVGELEFVRKLALDNGISIHTLKATKPKTPAGSIPFSVDELD